MQRSVPLRKGRQSTFFLDGRYLGGVQPEEGRACQVAFQAVGIPAQQQHLLGGVETGEMNVFRNNPQRKQGWGNRVFLAVGQTGIPSEENQENRQDFRN